MENVTDPNGFPLGADILDNAGQVVGSLVTANGRKGYLAILKGVFFTKGIFLPISAVDHVSVDGIYLNLGKEDLQDRRFDLPPEEGEVRT
jgi:hypothetical protein